MELLRSGVVKLEPLFIDVPPVEVLYHSTLVPDEALADKPIVEFPQAAAGVTFIVGSALTVMVTGLVTTQPFEDVASNVYVVVADAVLVGLKELGSSNPVVGVHA